MSPAFFAARLLCGAGGHGRRSYVLHNKLGWQFDIMSTSFVLSRHSLRPATHSGMPRWQDRLFIALARSANDATDYFEIPTDRVVEVGTQVTL
jgi:KUP system potassium uptake protein